MGPHPTLGMNPAGSMDYEAPHRRVDPTIWPEQITGTDRLPCLPTLDGLVTIIRVATVRVAPPGLVAALSHRSPGYVTEACRPRTSPGPAMYQAGTTGEAMLWIGTSPWEQLGGAERDFRGSPCLVRAGHSALHVLLGTSVRARTYVV